MRRWWMVKVNFNSSLIKIEDIIICITREPKTLLLLHRHLNLNEEKLYIPRFCCRGVGLRHSQLAFWWTLSGWFCRVFYDSWCRRRLLSLLEKEIKLCSDITERGKIQLVSILLNRQRCLLRQWSLLSIFKQSICYRPLTRYMFVIYGKGKHLWNVRITKDVSKLWILINLHYMTSLRMGQSMNSFSICNDTYPNSCSDCNICERLFDFMFSESKLCISCSINISINIRFDSCKIIC